MAVDKGKQVGQHKSFLFVILLPTCNRELKTMIDIWQFWKHAEYDFNV